MDDVVNRLAAELIEAIRAAVEGNDGVAACHARARDVGFEMKVTLEATIGFGNRIEKDTPVSTALATTRGSKNHRVAAQVTANDRRFLRALRIAADEAQHKEVE